MDVGSSVRNVAQSGSLELSVILWIFGGIHAAVVSLLSEIPADACVVELEVRVQGRNMTERTVRLAKHLKAALRLRAHCPLVSLLELVKGRIPRFQGSQERG